MYRMSSSPLAVRILFASDEAGGTAVMDAPAEETTVAAPEAPAKKASEKKATKGAKKSAKKAAPKKAAKKAAPKKAAKKKGTKAAKKSSKPRAKKEGLRKPQVRVLGALNKATRPLNRAEIAEKGEVDLAMLNSYVGSQDDKVRAKNDKLVCMSLVSLGFVKPAPGEEDGRGTYYSITASGKKAFEKAKAEERASK